MDEKIPAIVLAYSAQEKMTPIAWKITPEKVVIVFEEGPKKSFDRQPAGAIHESPLPKPRSAAVKKAANPRPKSSNHK